MIGIPETGTLQNATISAVSFEGLSVKSMAGSNARLAIIDDDGNILEAGPAVEKEAWNVAIACYKNFLIGNGHIRVFNSPPGSDTGKAAA